MAPGDLPELRTVAAEKNTSLFAYLIRSNHISLDQYRHFVQTYAIENLVAIFSWREGQFQFVEKQMKRSGTIQIEPLDLILNTARRCFVHEEFENSIDDHKVIFRVSPQI